MRVYKYKLDMKSLDYTNQIFIRMPKGAQVLRVQMQHGHPVMWAAVDPKAAPENRCFEVIATGHDARDTGEYRYVDTFQAANGHLVFHVFEVL